MRQAGPGLPFAALALTLGLLSLPVLAGLAGTVAPAFGYLPALGGSGLTVQPWRDLMDWPGLAASVRLSVASGVGATAVSLLITILIVATLHGTRAFTLLVRLLSPLLSLPHAAAALGMAFVIAPSGWIARALSPWATGWTEPPDLLITQDPMGLALLAGLVVKEVPFLLLMTLSALVQVKADRRMLVAAALGYGRAVGWFKAVLPAVYPQIRLPVAAVLAYSMTAVDVAMILGPTLPPPLSVQVVHWMSDPDLALRFRAAAAAVLQLGLVLGALVGMWVLEGAAARVGRAGAVSGRRGLGLDDGLRVLAVLGAGLCVAVVGLGLAGLALWSVTGMWPFPAVLPESWSLRVWRAEGMGLGQAAVQTVVIGSVAVVLALGLVVACLETEYRHGFAGAGRLIWVLYLPLIVPQVAFLPGLQTLALLVGADGGMAAVTAVHLVFVLPYVFLSLADPWRAWDRRAGLVAATLGAGPGRVLWAVRLPMLFRAVLTAAAVGFAVSVGLYLPTLMIGAGRIETLTTEAVALASGGNRRLIGAYALMQMAVPLAGFALALVIPALAFRHRRALRLAR